MYRIEKVLGPAIEDEYGAVHWEIEGWRVYQATYVTHYNSISVQRKDKWPRWKNVGEFQTEQEAQAYIDRAILPPTMQ